jgi:hypothetical protein
MPTNCIGIFCEDIRDEIGGTHTIIGIMPDNIHLAPGGSPPPDGANTVLFPKLGMYARVNLDPSYKGGAVTCRATFPGGPDIPLGVMDAETIKKAMEDSKARNFPTIGLIFKSVVAPLQVQKSIMLQIIVTINGVDIVCGALNIVLADGAIPATA